MICLDMAGGRTPPHGGVRHALAMIARQENGPRDHGPDTRMALDDPARSAPQGDAAALVAHSACELERWRALVAEANITIE